MVNNEVISESKVSFQFTFLINFNMANTRADHRLKNISMPLLRKQRSPKTSDIIGNPEPFLDGAMNQERMYVFPLTYVREQLRTVLL